MPPIDAPAPIVDSAIPVDRRSPVVASDADGRDAVVDSNASVVEGGAQPDSGRGEGDADSGRADSLVDAPPAACSSAQLAAREKPGYKLVPWAEMPQNLTDFLTTFLPAAYIQDHLRFYSPSSDSAAAAGTMYVNLEFGCETISGGQIQWGLAICSGKIRWIGPSQAWQLNIDRAEAVRRITAAGCNADNLELRLEQVNTPIPGIAECLGLSFHPAWVAGAQSVVCANNLPAGCHCYASRCSLNVDDGALATQVASSACPAK